MSEHPPDPQRIKQPFDHLCHDEWLLCFDEDVDFSSREALDMCINGMFQIIEADEFARDEAEYFDVLCKIVLKLKELKKDDERIPQRPKKA